jgi:glycosyltransferase involved in cell wall biosynthesis
MRILFLTQWFDPEPGAIRGLPLARWLRGHGHHVEVITGFPNYPSGKLYPGYQLHWRQKEMRDGIPILRVPLYPEHGRSFLGRVANYLSFMIAAATVGTASASPADVLYVYHPPPTVGMAGLIFKAFRRLPIVYHIADMWPESVIESGMLGRGPMRDFARACLTQMCSLLYRTAESITVLSPGFRRLLIERGVPSEKIHVVYNWTDEESFSPLPRDARLASELGLAGRFNVIYAGNHGPFQGLETLIQAAQKLRQMPEIQVVLIGEGQKKQELEELARGIGASNVRFLDNRPYNQMARINALAEGLVVHLRDLPFFSSTIPSKTQVAMASARPVVMAVRGDAADLIRSSGAGLMVEPENPAALADAILALYRMPAVEREAMGRRGRDFYMREMSLEIGGIQMEKLFESAAGRFQARHRATLADRLQE